MLIEGGSIFEYMLLKLYAIVKLCFNGHVHEFPLPVSFSLLINLFLPVTLYTGGVAVELRSLPFHIPHTTCRRSRYQGRVHSSQYF